MFSLLISIVYCGMGSGSDRDEATSLPPRRGGREAAVLAEFDRVGPRKMNKSGAPKTAFSGRRTVKFKPHAR